MCSSDAFHVFSCSSLTLLLYLVQAPVTRKAEGLRPAGRPPRGHGPRPVS